MEDKSTLKRKRQEDGDEAELKDVKVAKFDDEQKQELFSKSYEVQRIFLEYLFDDNWEYYLELGEDNSIINSNDIEWMKKMLLRQSVNLKNAGVHCYSHLFEDEEHKKIWLATELCGSYASKQHQLKAQIFNYEDYKSAGIEFYVFFISAPLSKKGPIYQVLLFDNYETENKTDFQLRFSWNDPISNKDIISREETHKEKINCISKKLQLKMSETQLLEKVIGGFSMVRKFSSDPVKVTLLEIEEKCSGKFDVRGQFGEVLGKTQIPILDPEDWRDLQQIRNPDGSPIFDEEYICLLATGSIPKAAQELATQYAFSLKKEERYDFSIYNGSEENEHEIFFILKADYSVCIGVFIFDAKINANCFNVIKDGYEKYLGERETKNKKVEEENISELFNSKLESNALKLEKAKQKLKEKAGNLFYAFYGYGQLQNNPECGKYISKISNFTLFSFFHKAKSKLPENIGELGSLRAAWIHPFHRRQGILTKLWPILQDRYGVFNIDMPSKAMSNFMENHSLGSLRLNNGKCFVC